MSEYEKMDVDNPLEISKRPVPGTIQRLSLIHI